MTDNAFLDAVRDAVARGWCMQPYCTTCAATEFRAALGRVAGLFGGPLCDALCELDPSELMVLPGWEGALEVAVRDLPIGSTVRTVLERWLTQVGRYPRFDDVVLYRIVRCLPNGDSLRQAWVRAAIPVAVELRDTSLVETLLLLLRGKAIEFPELLAVGVELSNGSTQLQRVLKNACGIATSA